MAVDGAGKFTVAWEQRYPVAVQTRRRLVSGALGTIQRVSPQGAPAERVRVAVADDGTAVFLWVSKLEIADGPDELTYKARMRRPDGTFGPVLDVSSPSQGLDGHAAAIAPDGTAAVVTWASNDEAVYARRISRSGALSPLRTVATAGDWSSPQAEVDSSGTAVLAWLYGGILRSRRLFANGTLGTTATISADAFRVSDLEPAYDVDLDAGGNATFLWRRPQSFEHYTRRRNTAGALGPVAYVGG